MIANFHTHTTFCDGENTPEEIVLAAIQKGFSAIGFSGHGNTPFDLRYCMKATEDYIAEIQRLKKKYKDKIEIVLGIEEDAAAWVDRSQLDYIIGSSHYLFVDGKYLPIDSDYGYFSKCLDAFGGDPLALSENYYHAFCQYISERKPDIIGHFDLITKFEEQNPSGLLSDPRYHAIAERYLKEAVKSGCIFEVNTNAIARGYRTAPYPSENLLRLLKGLDAKLILSSDSHQIETLDFQFSETKVYLRKLGFTHLYTLSKGKFVPYQL